ncbi:hypothetical protein ACIBCN_43525 [Nocardia sp. NPDC051052]|uniref:hypothetical protein n=1 Tax=Nocardia sp. NPDC051052 TaxID=3364322 RepID=UPI003798A447
MNVDIAREMAENYLASYRSRIFGPGELAVYPEPDDHGWCKPAAPAWGAPNATAQATVPSAASARPVRFEAITVKTFIRKGFPDY